MVETFLYDLRKGDLDNKDYQETLINSFLVRAYLFDNGELKMILRFTKEKKEVTKVLKDFARQGVGSDVKEVRLKSPIVHNETDTLQGCPFSLSKAPGFSLLTEDNAIHWREAGSRRRLWRKKMGEGPMSNGF